MNYTLTITADNDVEFRRIMAALIGTTAPVGMLQASGATLEDIAAHQAPVTVDDDDDNGPADATAPEVDSRGFAWDERIHAGTKARNKDGSWRYKRGVDESLIERVEASRNVMPPLPAFLDRSAQGTAAAPPAPTPEPAAAAAPIPVPSGAPVEAPPATYERVIATLTEALTAGKIAPEALPKFWTDCGVSGAAELVANQPAIDNAMAKLQTL